MGDKGSRSSHQPSSSPASAHYAQSRLSLCYRSIVLPRPRAILCVPTRCPGMHVTCSATSSPVSNAMVRVQPLAFGRNVDRQCVLKKSLVAQEKLLRVSRARKLRRIHVLRQSEESQTLFTKAEEEPFTHPGAGMRAIPSQGRVRVEPTMVVRARLRCRAPLLLRRFRTCGRLLV